MATNIFIADETSSLQTVILGTGASPGKPRGINAKAEAAIRQGSYPKEHDLVCNLAEFDQVLRANGVRVLRPQNIPNVNQIFVRDIGFVVGDIFVRARMREETRQVEYKGIRSIIKRTGTRVVVPPRGVTLEGGDVVLYKRYMFIGVGRRTNQAGVDFLKDLFRKKKIIPLKLAYESSDPDISVLHLDCVFQPVGKNYALLFPAGFTEYPGAIYDIFGRGGIIELRDQDLKNLCCNILSLSKKRVVSCARFHRLNRLLKNRGIGVSLVSYDYISQMGGLLRCSTLPLLRGKS